MGVGERAADGWGAWATAAHVTRGRELLLPAAPAGKPHLSAQQRTAAVCASGDGGGKWRDSRARRGQGQRAALPSARIRRCPLRSDALRQGRDRCSLPPHSHTPTKATAGAAAVAAAATSAPRAQHQLRQGSPLTTQSGSPAAAARRLQPPPPPTPPGPPSRLPRRVVRCRSTPRRHRRAAPS